MKHTLILLFLALAAYAQQERVAIINTLDDRDSMSISDLTYLTDKLREAAVNTLPSERFGVMTTESIVAFLGSLENTVRVCKESSCLAELGKKVSADYVAQGRIGRFGDNLTIKVELYNVKSGNLMGSFTGNFKDIFSLLTLIDEKTPDLFKKMLTEPKAQKPEPSPEVVPPVAPQSVPPVKTVNPADIQALIKNGLEKNKEQIIRESFYLSPSEKMFLYEENKKTSAVSLMLLNFIPGFGLGSYIQGDKTWGIVQSVIEVAGLGLTIISINKTIKINDEGDSYSICYHTDPTCKEKKDKLDDESKKMFVPAVAGIVIFGVGWFYGIWAPVKYETKYNKTLKGALNINDNISYSIDPLIIPRAGTPAVGLAFNVRY
ncbi:MAG: P13 family porin [Fibromonadaceae bacterium]|jgi:TolB-like protein|nr:P13 family porin [Fibromonadaceae bacterium]